MPIFLRIQSYTDHNNNLYLTVQRCTDHNNANLEKVTILKSMIQRGKLSFQDNEPIKEMGLRLYIPGSGDWDLLLKQQYIYIF